MQIIVFLLGLSLLITIHELGHFIVAKLFGVYCHEFSIGMGPAIFSLKKGETKYSLRWLPIGGYVSMAGEEVNSEGEEPNQDSEVKEKEETNDTPVDPDDIVNKENEVSSVAQSQDEDNKDIPYERTINGIKSWKRFLVIGAGVFMNFILAYILFFISVASLGIGVTDPCLSVSYESTESEVYAFEEANIPEGVLTIKSVENKIVYTYEGNEVTIFLNNFDNLKNFDEASNALGVYASIGEIIETFEDDIKVTNNDGVKNIKFTANKYKITQYLTIVAHGEETEDLKTYKPSREISKIEFNCDEKNNYTISGTPEMPKLGYTQAVRNATFGECFRYAGVMEVENGTAIFDALGKLFTKEGFQNVGGIIAMADASNQYLDYGFGYYMAFLGLISVNLGVMNLLPIPGLDGSQLLVIIAEGVSRKKLSNNTKAIINFIGLIFLLGLMVVITVKDVFQFLI